MSLPVVLMFVAMAPIALGVVLIARGRPIDEEARLRAQTHRPSAHGRGR